MIKLRHTVTQALSVKVFEMLPVLHWKTHIFYTLSFNPKFENVYLALCHSNFLREEPRHKANYMCKKFSPKTYTLAGVHPLHTDGQTTTIPRTLCSI